MLQFVSSVIRRNLTAACPSVLWHCWLGHVTRKTVSKMTYNVSSRTLNSTIPCRGLSRLLHTDLHWLDVPDRVQFKLCMTVRRCMQDKAPQYLKEYCISFSDTQSTASSLSQPSPSFCATSSSNFWPSGLRCCWSDGVELSTWRFTVRNVATIILDDS